MKSAAVKSTKALPKEGFGNGPGALRVVCLVSQINLLEAEDAHICIR